MKKESSTNKNSLQRQTWELNKLSSFLETIQNQTSSGRGRSELCSDEKQVLKKLAQNQITDSEKARIVPLLSSNETAMEFLAALTKKITNEESPPDTPSQSHS